MAKFVQTKYKKFKKEIIGEGPAKCKLYPNRIVELGMRDSGFTCSQEKQKMQASKSERCLNKKIRGISAGWPLEITPRFNCRI